MTVLLSNVHVCYILIEMLCVYYRVLNLLFDGVKDPAKVPAWLLVNKTVIPDFVIKDPKVYTCICLHKILTSVRALP